MGKKWHGSYGKSAKTAKSVKIKFQPTSETYLPNYKKTCSNCGGRGHDAKSCSSAAMCSVCGVPGHTKKECWNITKKCEICGQKGHLRNVCTVKTTQKTGPGWWRSTGKDSDGRGCMRCGASKFHPKHLCKSFNHKCELCGMKNHFENMCGVKPSKKARQAWKGDEKWKEIDTSMNEERDENFDLRVNEEYEERDAKMNEDWKKKDTDAKKNDEWKEMDTNQQSKGTVTNLSRIDFQKIHQSACEKVFGGSKTDSQAPDWKTNSTDWVKMPEKPWPATPPKTKKIKSQQNKECYCCGSWQHEKIFCPFAHRRCELCGRKGHLKQKCQQRRLDLETDLPSIPGPEEEEPEEEPEKMEEEPEKMEEEPEKEDTSCTCCGSLDHETEQCVFIDLTCLLCGMPGHMEKMCAMKPTESVPEPLCPPSKAAVPEPLFPPKVKEACFCCGSTGHMKSACPEINHVCAECGRQGHLESRCKKNLPECCLCCGEFGHQKASCPQLAAHCTWCGQEGHLRRMCTVAPKQDLIHQRHT